MSVNLVQYPVYLYALYCEYSTLILLLSEFVALADVELEYPIGKPVIGKFVVCHVKFSESIKYSLNNHVTILPGPLYLQVA